MSISAPENKEEQFDWTEVDTALESNGFKAVVNPRVIARVPDFSSGSAVSESRWFKREESGKRLELVVTPYRTAGIFPSYRLIFGKSVFLNEEQRGLLGSVEGVDPVKKSKSANSLVYAPDMGMGRMHMDFGLSFDVEGAFVMPLHCRANIARGLFSAKISQFISDADRALKTFAAKHPATVVKNHDDLQKKLVDAVPDALVREDEKHVDHMRLAVGVNVALLGYICSSVHDDPNLILDSIPRFLEGHIENLHAEAISYAVLTSVVSVVGAFVSSRLSAVEYRQLTREKIISALDAFPIGALVLDQVLRLSQDFPDEFDFDKALVRFMVMSIPLWMGRIGGGIYKMAKRPSKLDGKERK